MPFFIARSVTDPRAVANTLPRWKGHEHGNKYPATDEKMNQ
jgi:hypothetical protein